MNGLTVGEVIASRVAVGLAVLALAWVVRRACQRRVAGRQVHRLTIGLTPAYRIELQRQADEATGGSITDLICEALALHPYVRENFDAELLFRVRPDEPVIDLAVGSARRARRPRR